MIRLFFSFRGRINRGKYWLVVGVCMLGSILIALGFVFFELDSFGILLGFLASALLLISAMASGVKRLHDRDKSGWWLLFYWAGSGIFQGVGDALGGEGFAIVWYIASALVSISMLVDLGILRGTAGPNHYGADPLRNRTELKSTVLVGGERS